MVGTPGIVTKYDNLNNPARLTSTDLDPWQTDTEIWGVGLAAIRSRYVLVTGGCKVLDDDK